MAHIHEKIDFTVEVFIVHENKVLLRKHDKYKSWLSVGGHIELHEDMQEAALREVKEEVGLDVELIVTTPVLQTELHRYKHIITPVFINRHSITDTHEHVTFVYFAKSTTDELRPGVNEQTDNCQWFSMDELVNGVEGLNQTVSLYAIAALESVK